MSEINYKITLCSDAEPGSGFGTKLIDSLLPRNTEGDISIPASHLKGLIRENLELQAGPFIDSQVITLLFGEEGTGDGALLHFDAATSKQANTLSITRTSLNQYGVAKDTSLRTSEAVSIGTVFSGKVVLKANAQPQHVDLIKLGLLTLTVLGGSRNRGAGACYVSIDGESRTPGVILKQLATEDDWQIKAPASDSLLSFTENEETVLLKLMFAANNPVCVPDTPVIGNNVIKSGFSIPASAVQGVILHRINDLSPELATACFKSESFRTWPLNPVSDDADLSVRVSLTHKVSKLADHEGKHLFMDDSWEPYDVTKIPAHAPLKSADGVLLISGEQVSLWKSSMMAREISAHGVINGDRKQGQKRNLYTIESLAPMKFTGLVIMPRTAAELLKKSLSEYSHVQLGKSRSVRGGGKLTAEEIDFSDVPILHRENRVFIIQSPILIDSSDTNKPSAEILRSLAREAGLGEVEACSASISTLFGWNQTMNNGFLKAQAVLTPGSVFKTTGAPADLKHTLLKGLGKGKERGYGAILPHPGIATELYTIKPQTKHLAKEPNFALDGYELSKKALDNQLSISQVSRLRELLEIKPAAARDYIQRQRDDRPAEIWDRWAPVMNDIEQGIDSDPLYYARVLKVCQDLMQ